MAKITLGNPSGCQVDVVGKWMTNEVKAVTDSMGPQIIVIGPRLHLLSKPYHNHEEAIEKAKLVVKSGPLALPGDFIDLRRESFGDAMLRIAFSTSSNG